MSTDINEYDDGKNINLLFIWYIYNIYHIYRTSCWCADNYSERSFPLKQIEEVLKALAKKYVPNEDAPIIHFCIMGSQIVEKNILLYFFTGALEMIHSAHLEILFQWFVQLLQSSKKIWTTAAPSRYISVPQLWSINEHFRYPITLPHILNLTPFKILVMLIWQYGRRWTTMKIVK